MTTFSFVLIVVGLAFVGWMLFRLGTSWSYTAGYEKGRAEATVIVVSSGNNLGMVLFVLGFLALIAYLL